MAHKFYGFNGTLRFKLQIKAVVHEWIALNQAVIVGIIKFHEAEVVWQKLNISNFDYNT